MTLLKEWLGDNHQRLMTHLANRTFKKNPNLLDRAATGLLKKMIGEVPDDPELDHPE